MNSVFYMEERSKPNFIQPQGFSSMRSVSYGLPSSSLIGQPWLIGILVLLGIEFQIKSLPFIFCPPLLWNALVPRFHIFNRIYNRRFRGIRKDRVFRILAQPSRRFSQNLSGGLALGICVSLLAEWKVVVIYFEALLGIGLSAPILSRFCVPASIYPGIQEEIHFAKGALRWSRG